MEQVRSPSSTTWVACRFVVALACGVRKARVTLVHVVVTVVVVWLVVAAAAVITVVTATPIGRPVALVAVAGPPRRLRRA